MQYGLHRKNGEIVILSEEELNMVYLSAQLAWHKDYIVDMLNWSGYDSESLTMEQIEEITEKFLSNRCLVDKFGELEADVFDKTMEKDFSEIKKIEEDE